MRCLSRRPEYLRARVAPSTEVVHGDVLRPETIRAPALEGVDTAYYLVHSMSSSRPFDEADRRGARVRRRGAGCRRAEDRLPGRARSRRASRRTSPAAQEVGRILRASGVPTIEFRASIVIGSGSALVRDDPRPRREAAGDGDAALGARAAQPIAIEDVLAYLARRARP